MNDGHSNLNPDYEFGALKSRVDSHESWIRDLKVDTLSHLTRIEDKVDDLSETVNRGRGISGLFKFIFTLVAGIIGGHEITK